MAHPNNRAERRNNDPHNLMGFGYSRNAANMILVAAAKLKIHPEQLKTFCFKMNDNEMSVSNIVREWNYAHRNYTKQTNELPLSLKRQLGFAIVKYSATIGK